MDSGRFDAFTRAASGAGSRRLVLGRIAASLAALTVGAGLTEGQAACAKKGKRCGKTGKGKNAKNIKCCNGLTCKNKKCACKPGSQAPGCELPCRFDRTTTLWTLQGDCTTREPIRIPDGVTLDGNGFTIKLAGSVRDIDRYGVIETEDVQGTVAVRNLKIDASGIQCASNIGGVVALSVTGFAATVTDVSIVDHCGSGIIAFDYGQGGTFSFTRVSVSRVGDEGLFLQAGFSFPRFLVDDCDLTDITGTAISSGFALLEVTNTRITNAAIGIDCEVSVGITVDGSRFENVGYGILLQNGSGGPITNNTIIGRGPVSLASPPIDLSPSGVIFLTSSGGSATGNTISNFLDPDPDPAAVSCGIADYSGNEGQVTISGNTFPSPGNERNLCP